MSQNYHIFQPGELKREENTLAFRGAEDNKGEVKHIPIESVETIIFHSTVSLNTELLDFFRKHNLSAYFFNWSGKYIGSFIPPSSPKSGELLMKQVESIQHPVRRSKISKEIVKSSMMNMKRNVEYYKKDYSSLSSIINEIESCISNLSQYDTREEIMGLEAQSKKAYYNIFDIVTPQSLEFSKRSYNPPKNEINSLISFGNSMLYSNTSSAICKTGLNPTLSYLHVPGNRRDSLSLDIADIFKPVIVDRMILRLLNRKQITEDDFENNVNNILLTENGRKTFLKEYEDVLDKTIEHPDLKRHVSYQTLLKLESQKLKKHILTGEEYNGFKRWW